MYKNIRNFLIMTIVCVLMIAGALVMILNNKTWENDSKNYIESKQQIIEHFIDNNIHDLNNILDSHAVWTDAIVGLNSNDSDWLYENATGFIVDEESYNIDFIYISTESKDFKEYYGVDYALDFESIGSYNKALEFDENSSEILWINGNPTIITATPFYDNEHENPTGCYLIGRILNAENENELKILLTAYDVEEITFSQNALFPEIELIRKHQIKMSIPLMDGDNNFVNIFFDVGLFDRVFNKQLLSILGILLIAAAVMIRMIIYINRRVVIKLVEIIGVIEGISIGNYKAKLKPINSKMLLEVNTLIKSVNRMSNDIECQIETINTNAKLLDEKYYEMVKLLVDVVEMNDYYTYHHSLSVSEYAHVIGEAIGFKDLSNLQLASKLHDVGKIAIPTHILNKSAKLNFYEYEIVKRHPENGYKLLSKIEMFKEASVGVRYHHERYDGNGYPEGLVGYEIPLMAQIISVADIFEALTSDRSYRKAMTHEEAMTILIEEKGRKLNPVLVDVFYNEMKTKY